MSFKLEFNGKYVSKELNQCYAYPIYREEFRQIIELCDKDINDYNAKFNKYRNVLILSLFYNVYTLLT